jgi:hypothetical protein
MSNVLPDNIIVAGVTRNCEKTIEKDIFKIYQALKTCKNLMWLIIESDSDDGTVSKLEDLKMKIPDFRYISLGRLRNEIPKRTARIAHCRNRYLEEMYQDSRYKDVEYAIVADLDGMNNLLTTEGFISCWLRKDWDVCTANQRGPYYDMYALRHPVWSPNDCLLQHRFLLKYGVRKMKSLSIAIYGKMIRIPEESEWIEVDSAYGGLAIYRRKSLLGAQYRGLDDEGEEMCEHIALHNFLRQKGNRIYINPKLINSGYNRHNRHIILRKLIRIWEGIKI